MISIIIPVLNEATTIVALLEHVIANTTAAYVSEIIVVDGASIDETVDLIASFSETSAIPIQCIPSEKGRAKQMNRGAAIAKSDVLYFLHADSYPPKNFDALIISEVKKGNNAGCFKMKFNSKYWWLQLMGWFTKFNWQACRGGDQSQFITKSLFQEIGGYDETYTIYEDNILINQLYMRNQFTVIPHALTTSARRYEEKGVWKLQYHFLIIYIKKWMGATAEELYAYYLKNIK